MAAASTIQTCLKDASHYDPDNRYMAISDLIEHMNRGTAIDDRTEAE